MKFGIIIYSIIGIWVLVQFKKTKKWWYLLFLPILFLSFLGTTENYVNLQYNTKILIVISMGAFSIYTISIIFKDYNEEKIRTRKMLKAKREEIYKNL